MEGAGRRGGDLAYSELKRKYLEQCAQTAADGMAREPARVACCGEHSVNGTHGREAPLCDYDVLTAQQVLAAASGLPRERIEHIRAYEEHHRRRKSLIGRLKQLGARRP